MLDHYIQVGTYYPCSRPKRRKCKSINQSTNQSINNLWGLSHPMKHKQAALCSTPALQSDLVSHCAFSWGHPVHRWLAIPWACLRASFTFLHSENTCLPAGVCKPGANRERKSLECHYPEAVTFNTSEVFLVYPFKECIVVPYVYVP